MIALSSLILLIVRLNHFSKLTLADLPQIGDDDLRHMKRYSKIALGVVFVFSILSFVPHVVLSLAEDAVLRGGHIAVAAYAVLRGGVRVTNAWSLGLTVVGLLVAATFDLKAERIKKRGKPAQARKEDQVRWYHILVALLLPYVGLPWGIVNLCRKRRRSGLPMVIMACIMLLFLLVFLAWSRF